MEKSETGKYTLRNNFLLFYFGMLSKSTCVQNPFDQNPPAFKIHPIEFYILVIH